MNTKTIIKKCVGKSYKESKNYTYGGRVPTKNEKYKCYKCGKHSDFLRLDNGKPICRECIEDNENIAVASWLNRRY